MTCNHHLFAADLLEQLCDAHPLPYKPRLIWKRYRVTAGMAYYRQGTIGLSSIVLQSEQQVRETLIHEYAHLLAVARHGNKAAGHGEPWKRAMRELGLEPIVHHRFEVQRNQTRQRVIYECLRCGKLIDRARRLPKRRKYQHAGCGGMVRLKAVERAG